MLLLLETMNFFMYTQILIENNITLLIVIIQVKSSQVPFISRHRWLTKYNWNKLTDSVMLQNIKFQHKVLIIIITTMPVWNDNGICTYFTFL